VRGGGRQGREVPSDPGRKDEHDRRRVPPGSRPDLHLEIESLAASISMNHTRFSTTLAAHSGAHSRLDHRSTRERELVQALGE
jgi:hypothetical protein